MTSHSRQRLLSPERDRAGWRSMAWFSLRCPHVAFSWVTMEAPSRPHPGFWRLLRSQIGEMSMLRWNRVLRSSFPIPAMAKTHPSPARVSPPSQKRVIALRQLRRHITNGILCFSQVVIARRLCGSRQATHGMSSGTGKLPRHNGRTVVMRHAIGVAGVWGGNRVA